MGKKIKDSNDGSKGKKQFEIVVDEASDAVAYNCDELGEMIFDNEESGRERLFYVIENNMFYERSIEYSLRKAGLIGKANELREILRKHSNMFDIDDEGWLCACYCLSSTLQYPIRTKTYITRLDEIPKIWEKHGLRFNDAPDSLYAVCEEDFVYWLAHRNPLLAAKVKALQARKASPYEIAYTMFPNLSYDFKTGDKNFPISTPKDIGRNLNEWANHYINKLHRTPNTTFSDLNLESGGRIEAYLKTHPAYAGYVSVINSCLRARKPWASGRYAPYNGFVALYQLSKALGHSPFYAFPDGRHIFNLDDLKEIPADQIETALNSGYLAAWIATFFQDDPTKTLNDEASYAREAIRFTDFISSLSPSYLPAKKYRKALGEIDRTAAKYKKATRPGFTSAILKWIFVPVAILMFLLVIAFNFMFHIPDYNVIAHHYLGFSLVIGIVVIVYTLAFGLTFLEALIWGGVIGFGGTWILKLLMGLMSPYLTWVYLAIVLAAFIFFMVKLWPVYQSVPGYAYVIDVANPDFKLREMAALNYAYGSKSYNDRGDSEIGSYLSSYKRNKNKAQRSQFGYSLGAIGTAFLLLIGLFLLSPAFGGEKSLLYDTVSNEAEVKIVESADSVKPEVKKKPARKSKSRSAASPTATAVENNLNVTGTESELPAENKEEIYNAETQEETLKYEEVPIDQLPQALRDKLNNNRNESE